VGGKEFILAIIVIVLLYKLFDSWTKNRAGRHEQALHEQAREALARVTELEERIRVLERIVTDDGYDVRREFRNLGSSAGSQGRSGHSGAG
jgi:phage shock protein C